MTAKILPLAEYCFSKTEPKPVLRCNGCGTTTEAACDCNVGYHPVKAAEAARKAILANPNASNRMIAEKIGVSKDTVRLERNELADNSPVEKREGLDGKIRKMPTPSASTVAFKKKQRAEAKTRKEEVVTQRASFIVRSYNAAQMAYVEGEVDPEMVECARVTAGAWLRLYEQMTVTPS